VAGNNKISDLGNRLFCPQNNFPGLLLVVMSTSKHKFHIHISFLLAIVILLFCQGVSFAHLGKVYIPDPIAEMEYRILLEFTPEDTAARNKLVMVLYRLGNFKEAENELDRVLEIDPANFDALDAYGLVKIKQENYAQALECFKAAIAINPADPLVYHHLGMAQEEMGLLTDAEDSYQTALQKEKEQPKTDNGGNLSMIEAALKNIRAKMIQKQMTDGGIK